MLWGSDFPSLFEIWSVNKNVCSYQWRIVCDWSKQLERFSYDLEMITREQKRNNKRTEIERFDWFIERILQHDWPIEQCLLHIRVFLEGKRRVRVLIFSFIS